ncbi:hypothetical protein SNE40_006123 [Patella caerulea]|uniref:Uncharacterized protein n=1 Tax=Patella caerulea TaxID=87958 RepID=A0AAN8JW75_PATCE
MYSERVMGHVDHQHKRAPNATYGSIDGKVKAIKNKTLSWLDSKSLTDQKCFVRYSIKRGDNIRTVRKLRDETCTIEKQNRLTIKCHKFDAQQRNRIQMARVVFKEVTLEDAFPSVDSETLTILRSVANHPESLVDRYIHHNWFEKDQNKLYFGKITEMNLKKRQRNKVYIKLEEYTICYWDESESGNVGVDFDISLTEVLSDIYTGDFTLL